MILGFVWLFFCVVVVLFELVLLGNFSLSNYLFSLVVLWLLLLGVVGLVGVFVVVGLFAFGCWFGLFGFTIVGVFIWLLFFLVC